MEHKGFIDSTNVILTNKKFKHFSYQEEPEKELNFNLTDDLKVFLDLEVIPFFKAIDFLYKQDFERVVLKYQGKEFILKSNYQGKEFNFKIPLLNLDGYQYFKSVYSVEYLYNFLKEYSLKQLGDIFKLKIECVTDEPIILKLNKDWGIIAPRINEDE